MSISFSLHDERSSAAYLKKEKEREARLSRGLFDRDNRS